MPLYWVDGKFLISAVDGEAAVNVVQNAVEATSAHVETDDVDASPADDCDDPTVEVN